MAKWKIKISDLTVDGVVVPNFEFDLDDDVWWVRLIPNLGGITLSRNKVRLRWPIEKSVFYNPTIVLHESVHILQARKLGWKYLLTYLWQAVTSGFRKSHIKFEQQAYANERHGTYTKLLYS